MRKSGLLIVIILILLVLVCLPVQAATILAHVSAAYVIGDLSSNETQSFIFGFFSHGLLDTVYPEYCFEWENNSAVTANSDFLAFEIVLSGVMVIKIFRETDPVKRHNMLYALLGSLLPDLIDGANYLANGDDYEPIIPWHRYSSSEVQTKSQTMRTDLVLMRIAIAF